MFKDLFEYGQIVEACDECFGFSNCTLKASMGQFPAGTKLYGVWFNLDFDNPTVHIFETEEDAKQDKKIVLPFKLVVG